MHAIVHTMTITDSPANRARLVDEVVPRVRQLPGFVRGIWVSDPSAGTATALVVFDTQEAAEAVAATLRDPSHHHDDTVTTSVEVCELAAEA